MNMVSECYIKQFLQTPSAVEQCEHKDVCLDAICFGM